MSHGGRCGCFIPGDLFDDRGKVRLHFGNAHPYRVTMLGEHFTPGVVRRFALCA